MIIGGEVLEMAQGGFGRAEFWSMCVDGKTLEIPLIGQHSSNVEVKRVQGAKKIRKLLREHGQFGEIGYIWKAEEKTNSDDSQDEDAQNGLLGVDKLREVINAGGSCASQQTTSTQKTKMAKRRARDIAVQEQIDRDKQHMADSSARIKAQLRAEFPKLFETPDHLPPLRWEKSQGGPRNRCTVSTSQRAAAHVKSRDG